VPLGGTSLTPLFCCAPRGQWAWQDNHLQDVVYRELDDYAQMQRRVRNPRFGAELEQALVDPAFDQLQNEVMVRL
jgi:hypothetical protein